MPVEFLDSTGYLFAFIKCQALVLYLTAIHKTDKLCQVYRRCIGEDFNLEGKEEFVMTRIKTLSSRNLAESAKKGGCGECQTSCQSASKTSCSVANQKCEQLK